MVDRRDPVNTLVAIHQSLATHNVSPHRMTDQNIHQANILIQRLERLSADSACAHRASGIRAALDKLLNRIEADRPYSSVKLDALLQAGYEILERAAREIPSPQDIHSDG